MLVRFLQDKVNGEGEQIMSNIDQQFVAWHLKRNNSNLERHFELGDILLNAVVVSGVRFEEVLRRLKKCVKECYLLSDGYYHHSHQLAKVFNAQQRQVLLDKYVPCEVAMRLASHKFDEGSKRSTAVSNIKKGKLTHPYAAIMGKRAIRRADDLDSGIVDSGNNPNNIVLAKPTGDFDQDVDCIVNVLRNIKSRFGADKYIEAIKRVR